MLRFSRLGVLLAAVALGGLLPAAAVAAEWHTNGNRALFGTHAQVTRFVIHSGGTTVVEQGCLASTVSGTLNGPTSTALPWVNAATVTPVFSGCRVVFGAPYTLVCSPIELRANSYLGGPILATAGGGVTTGLLTNIDCKISISGTPCSTVTGTLPVQYINPSPIATGAGTLTLTSVSQPLTLQAIFPGCAPFSSGTATLGTPATALINTDITYTINGPNAPYIFRTP